MIFIRIYRVAILPSGKRTLERTKFANGETKISLPNDYGMFDILDVEEWRNHLANEFLYDGQLLPHKTVDSGERVHYEVEMYGATSEVYNHFVSILPQRPNKRHFGGKFSLFPGYILQGKEMGTKKDIRTTGWIRKHEVN